MFFYSVGNELIVVIVAGDMERFEFSLYSINRQALEVTNCPGDVVEKLAETVQTTICDSINNK